jgi:hypothetical protein
MSSTNAAELAEMRALWPDAVAEAAQRRTRRPLVGDTGRLMIIAADHPARAALAIGDRPLAMGNRIDLLDRLLVALSRPGVDGVLGTADILEDLLLLGALEGKLAIGSMNRGGLAGSSFELDDRFTAYDAAQLAALGFDGGKMLLRIDPDDPGSLDTLTACAAAVGDLAAHHLAAMVEPFWATRVDGRVRTVLDAEGMTRAISVAAGLGNTSARKWLKVPVVQDMERALQASTLPALLLGGDVSKDPDGAFARWSKALALPTVRGLVVGRALLYPPDDDVAAAVDTAVGLL